MKRVLNLDKENDKENYYEVDDWLFNHVGI